MCEEWEAFSFLFFWQREPFQNVYIFTNVHSESFPPSRMFPQTRTHAALGVVARGWGGEWPILFFSYVWSGWWSVVCKPLNPLQFNADVSMQTSVLCAPFESTRRQSMHWPSCFYCLLVLCMFTPRTLVYFLSRPHVCRLVMFIMSIFSYPTDCSPKTECINAGGTCKSVCGCGEKELSGGCSGGGCKCCVGDVLECKDQQTCTNCIYTPLCTAEHIPHKTCASTRGCSCC